MLAIADSLSSNKAITISFVLMLLCGLGFGIFADSYGGVLMDLAMDEEGALATLAGLTPEQKNSHFWVTVLLDSAYPLCYGAFFVGAIARLAGKHRVWAIWPNLIGVDCDYAENIVQAMALSGNTDWLWLKDFVAPVKMAALAIGVLFIIGFGIRALLNRKKINRNKTQVES